MDTVRTLERAAETQSEACVVTSRDKAKGKRTVVAMFTAATLLHTPNAHVAIYSSVDTGAPFLTEMDMFVRLSGEACPLERIPSSDQKLVYRLKTNHDDVRTIEYCVHEFNNDDFEPLTQILVNEMARAMPNMHQE